MRPRAAKGVRRRGGPNPENEVVVARRGRTMLWAPLHRACSHGGAASDHSAAWSCAILFLLSQASVSLAGFTPLFSSLVSFVLFALVTVLDWPLTFMTRCGRRHLQRRRRRKQRGTRAKKKKWRFVRNFSRSVVGRALGVRLTCCSFYINKTPRFPCSVG